MRRADEDGLAGMPQRRWIPLAGCQRRLAADDQGVDADQRHALVSVVEHRRPDLARIVHGFT